MSLEILHHYEGAVRKQHPHTHLLETRIPSIGQREGCHIPDLLLTMQYRLDAQGNVLCEPLLTFQADGPSYAQLNFRHDSVRFKHAFSVCRFEVTVDAIFGSGVVVTEGPGGPLDLTKFRRGRASEDGVWRRSPGSRFYLHGVIEGMLTSKENRLEAWGYLL